MNDYPSGCWIVPLGCVSAAMVTAAAAEIN
jgi:hypothetical protein